MEILSIGKLNFESFTPFVDIREQPMQEYPWTQVDAIALTATEETQQRFAAAYSKAHSCKRWLMKERSPIARCAIALLLNLSLNRGIEKLPTD